MDKATAMIEAAIHILHIAATEKNKGFYQTTLKGIPIQRCPDADLEKEISKKEYRFCLDDRAKTLHEELALRKSFGIKIEKLEDSENE